MIPTYPVRIQVEPICDIAVECPCDVAATSHFYILRRRGDVATLRRGDVATLRRGDVATLRRGNIAKCNNLVSHLCRRYVAATLAKLWPMSPNIAFATSRRCRNRYVAAMSQPRRRGDVATATSRRHREVQQFSVAFVSPLCRRDIGQCRGDIAATQMRH